MKIQTSILCLPVTDLDTTLGFYRQVFGLDDAEAEDGIIAIELPNLSLFLMAKDGFEFYTRQIDRDALMPGSSAPAVISCAVETREDVDGALAKAEAHGGSGGGPAAVDAASGGYTGYLTDPDGHLWELVCPQPR